MAKGILAIKVKNLFLDPQPQAQLADTKLLPATLASPASNLLPLSLAVAVESPPVPSAATGTPGEPSPPVVAVQTAPPPVASPAGLSPVRLTSQPTATPNALPPRPQPERPRRRRAIGLKGAVIMSQDGVTVYFVKKCSTCGFEDVCRSNMLIGHGVTRAHFFCPKCRKNREVQIQGMAQ